jgi:hypothetical protein
LVRPSGASLADRVAKTGAAEIDREHARAREALRRLDRVLSGAAAGDQNVEAPCGRGRADGAAGNWLRRYQSIVTGWPTGQREPTGVGHVLVLALNLARDLILDV